MADLIHFVDEIRRVFPVARSDRRKNANLFGAFIGPDLSMRDDDVFYSALAKMMAGKGIEALRHFDHQMFTNGDKKKTFAFRGFRHLRSYLISNGESVEDPPTLTYDFPSNSFEAGLQDFLTQLFANDHETKGAINSSEEASGKEREMSDWGIVSRNIAQQATSLTEPDSGVAREILKLAERLVEVCRKFEQERTHLVQRWQGMFERLTAVGADPGKRLGKNVGSEHLDQVEDHLNELEVARSALGKARSELQSLTTKAREALERGDLEAEARLIKLRFDAHYREKEITDRTDAAQRALEKTLQAYTGGSVGDIDGNAAKPEEIGSDISQTAKTAFESTPDTQATADRLTLTQDGHAMDALDPVGSESLSKHPDPMETEDSDGADTVPEPKLTDVNAEDDRTKHTAQTFPNKEVGHEYGESSAEIGGQDTVSPDFLREAASEESSSNLELEEDTEQTSGALIHFLERGEVAFAWHLTRILETQGTTLAIPAAVLRALILLRDVRTSEDMADERRGKAMAEMMDALPRATNRAAASRLALTALLRPALLDPSYGARSQLQNLLREDGLDSATPLIDALAKLGHNISLSDETLSDLAGTKRRDRLKEAREALSGWLEHARRRKTVHQPTYSILHRELRPEGEIGKVIAAAIANTPDAEALVRELLEKLDNNHVAQDAFVSEAQQRNGRPKKNRIEGMALEWFRRNLQEACNLLRDWLTAHREQTAMPQDPQNSALRRAVGKIRKVLEAVAKQDEGKAPTARGLVAATDAVLRQGFEDLRNLLNGVGKLNVPRRDVFETPTLRLPSGCQDWTDQDDCGFDAERKHRDRRMFEALLQGKFATDFREAFNLRIQESAILSSIALIDLMQSEGLATDAELAEYRQRLEETNETARRKARDEVERLRQSFATISYLEIESGDQVRDILTRLSAISDALAEGIDMDKITLPAISGARVATVPPDFPELYDVLPAFKENLERQEKEITARQKQALENLSDGRFGGSAKTILAEMKRLDPVTVDHVIAELEAGRDVLPLPKSDAPDEFERFFPDFASGLDEAKEDQLARGRVINALIEGGITGPLDFSRLDNAGRRRAREFLDTWSRLEGAMKQARPDQISEILEVLFGRLGFTGVRLSREREVTRGMLRQFIIDCDPVKPDGWFLPPAFGSVAAWNYCGAVVRGDIGPEQILRVIGAEAPDRPWIVVILRRLSVRERRVLAHKARSEARQILVLDESLLLYLGARGHGEDPLTGLFACALPFGWVQPYVTRAGPIPAEMFFGRQEEISHILARDGGGCLIYGGRQLGKSALLNHIRTERHRPESGELAIYLDIKPVGGVGTGPERIWYELHHKLNECPGLSSESPDANEIVRMIEHWLKGNPSRRLLAMFDETDNFLRAEHAGGYLNLHKLKSLMEDTGMRFKAVFAGLHNVRRMAQAPNSPLPHLGKPICIGPMNQTRENRTALRRLATEPMRAAGLKYDDPALASDMLARMNYYPSLVQVFCRQVVETLGRRAFVGQDGPRWHLSREILFEGEAAQKAAEQIRDHFQLTLNLDIRYECIAKSLALRRLKTGGGDAEVLSKGLTSSNLLKHTSDFWPESLDQPHVTDIEDLLEEMVDLGVLSNFANNRYGLRSALVAQLLGSHERLETDLLALSDRDPEPAYDAAEFHSLLRSDRPAERAPLSDRILERLFDHNNPGLRLVIGWPAIIGPELGQRIKVAADIWQKSDNPLNNPLVQPKVQVLRRRIDDVVNTDTNAVLVIEGAWKAKIAENLARQPSVIKGQILPIWCLDQEPEDLPDEIPVYHTKPWSDAMVRQWLADENLAPVLDDADSRSAIIKASGGAPARLKAVLPVLKELVPRSVRDIGEQLRGWTEKNPVAPDSLGLDDNDREFLQNLSEFGDAISSREDMQRELPNASAKRISKLTALGLLRDGGAQDQVPKVTPFGLLIAQ